MQSSRRSTCNKIYLSAAEISRARASDVRPHRYRGFPCAEMQAGDPCFPAMIRSRGWESVDDSLSIRSPHQTVEIVRVSRGRESHSALQFATFSPARRKTAGNLGRMSRVSSVNEQMFQLITFCLGYQKLAAVFKLS